jgi:hypothetical protein
MLHPNTPNAGRTALFVEVEVLDHEVDAWTVWRPAARSPRVDLDGLLQQAVDAGFDDVRARVHSTGCPDERLTFTAGS